jgi:hypothetical protein
MAAQPAGPSAWGFYHLVVSKPVSAAELAVEQSAGVAAAGGDLPSAAPTSALGQASAAAPSASPGCGGQILYQDNFDTLDPSWGAADQSFTVKNGALMVSAAAAMTTARSNTKAHYGDFDVCLLAGSPLSPNAAGSGGLIFWASDARNFYVLAVSSGGSYAILRYTAGEVSAPVPWGPTDALKPGAGVWNALEVKAVGTTATIVINGRKPDRAGRRGTERKCDDLGVRSAKNFGSDGGSGPRSSNCCRRSDDRAACVDEDCRFRPQLAIKISVVGRRSPCQRLSS